MEAEEKNGFIVPFCRNKYRSGGHQHRGKGSNLGLDDAGNIRAAGKIKMLFVFSFFIFCPQRVGADTVGGKGDGGQEARKGWGQ